MQWRNETHMFHVYIGKTSLTLLDVVMLVSILIDEAPVTDPTTFNKDKIRLYLLGHVSFIEGYKRLYYVNVVKEEF